MEVSSYSPKINHGFSLLLVKMILVVSMVSCISSPEEESSRLLTQEETSTNNSDTCSFENTNLIGCSTNSSIGHEITFDELLERWLSGIPCVTPCWEQITPGQTKSNEAEKVLSENPFFRNIEVTTYKGLSTGYLGWNIQVQDEDNNQTLQSGFAMFDTETSIVFAIEPGRINTGLGKLIKAFNNPSDVYATLLANPQTGTYDYWHIDIIWQNLGFYVSSGGPLPVPKIDDELIFEKIVYFIPGINGYFVSKNANLYISPTTSLELAERLKMWEGFSNFESYQSEVP